MNNSIELWIDSTIKRIVFTTGCIEKLKRLSLISKNTEIINYWIDLCETEEIVFQAKSLMLVENLTINNFSKLKRLEMNEDCLWNAKLSIMSTTWDSLIIL